MEAQYGKFLDMIRAVRINVPLVDALAGMPNYGKFLKELVSNKHKLEQISSAFLSDESSAMIQNKVPPKLGDPGSFLIPCNFSKAFSFNALADLGASINFMSYSLYAKLSLETLKPTKMSIRLADRSFQHPIRIAKNMLVEDSKFTFPVDFIILEMEEDSKVPLILGRPFLYTDDAVIRVKQKQLNLGVEEDFDALLDERSKILHSIKGTILEEKLFAEFDEFMAMTADENSESEDTKELPFEKIAFNTNHKIKTFLEEPPLDLELKPLPDNLEYVFLEEPSFLTVILSSQLFEQNKNKLISVLKRHKQAFAWKTIDIPGICSSFCKHKIQLLEDKKPVVQKQRRLNPNMQEVVKKEIVKLLDTVIIYPIADSPWLRSAKMRRQRVLSDGQARRFSIILLMHIVGMISKSFDEGYSSKNYVRKFLRALHPKWRAKVMAIEESKDLTSLSLDELIGTQNVHVIDHQRKIPKIVKEKVERKSIALKAKKESSDEECLTSGSEDKEYAMAVRDFNKFFKRRGRLWRQPRNDKRSSKKP
ncbi:reverse transcriptase domain-containing protein [Tanacetum coccineum]